MQVQAQKMHRSPLSSLTLLCAIADNRSNSYLVGLLHWLISEIKLNTSISAAVTSGKPYFI